MLLASLVVLARAVVAGVYPWLGLSAALGWIALTLAADHGYLDFLSGLGRSAAVLGRLIEARDVSRQAR